MRALCAIRENAFVNFGGLCTDGWFHGQIGGEDEFVEEFTPKKELCKLSVAGLKQTGAE